MVAHMRVLHHAAARLPAAPSRAGFLTSSAFLTSLCASQELARYYKAYVNELAGTLVESSDPSSPTTQVGRHTANVCMAVHPLTEDSQASRNMQLWMA